MAILKTTTLATLRSVVESRSYEVQVFAPTSRAVRKLNEAGIETVTLQDFLARDANAGETAQKHFYALDEPSLDSSSHILDFLVRLEANDRVLLIGDTCQSQGVELAI